MYKKEMEDEASFGQVGPFTFKRRKKIGKQTENVTPSIIIKTARSIEAINDAVDEGFIPLIQKVVPSEKIYVKEVLIRNKKTGKYKTMIYNYYAVIVSTSDDNEVVMKTTFYPYQFPLPYAAYLIPHDLQKGERVILEDLIEDIVGASYAGCKYRQDSAEAIWNGEKFIVDMDSFNFDMSMG